MQLRALFLKRRRIKKMTNSSSIINQFLNPVKGIDLYINYRCGLRCNHCFIGDTLNSNIEMPYELAKLIVNASAEYRHDEITLLGGEPTLYSSLIHLMLYITSKNIKIRIVTNGQKSFHRMMKNIPFDLMSNLHVCFSIDGSNEKIHDSIRGKGTFKNLIQSITLCKEMSVSMSGISSISTDNYNDILKIVKECESHQMKYLNIHYVTNRGFAISEKVVSIPNWTNLYSQLIDSANDFKIAIRFEKTFINDNEKVECLVVNKKNLIITPDGKIFACTMFMEIPNTHSATWTTNGIIKNTNPYNENYICGSKISNGCPALPLINAELLEEAAQYNYCIDCIFNKTKI